MPGLRKAVPRKRVESESLFRPTIHCNDRTCWREAYASKNLLSPGKHPAIATIPESAENED